MKPKLTSWQVAVAAEAITAAQFARCGSDVSVQYGADQPEYDLIVAKCHRRNKTSAVSPVLKLEVRPTARTRYPLYNSF